MKKLIFIILTAMLASIPGAWAAIKTPVGAWRLTTTTQIQITSSTGKTTFKGSKTTGTEFVTFWGDYSYTSSEWINRLRVYFNDTNGQYLMPLDVFGQWYGTNTTFTVSYDTFALSFRDKSNESLNAPFFDRIGYISFLASNLGYTPSIDSVRIVAYADSGKLTNSGQGLNGTKKVILEASWKQPDTSKALSSKIDVIINYTGKRHTVVSSCCGNDATQNTTDSQAFLTANASLTGVNKTSSGLQYVLLQEGTGDSPKSTDTVTVNYRGFYPSGAIFDSNSLISFKLNEVIAGWTEGLQLMKKGAKYRFFIPAELAYGAGSATIKPNAALVFDVELLNFTPS